MNTLDSQDKPYLYVDNIDVYKKAVTALQEANAVMLDTEFIRYRNFFPKLSLIQAYDGRCVYLFDYPALNDAFSATSADVEGAVEGGFWAGFVDFLVDESIVKVFHACDEDIELLHYCFDVFPVNVIDTQLAAGLVGLDYPMGFARMIESLQGVVVEKGDSRSDWLQRPLTTSQLSYAINDVYYLLPAYECLIERVEEQSRLDFLHSDYQKLCEHFKAQDFSEAYQRVNGYWRLDSQALVRLMRLTTWRERMMRECDLPRKKIAENDALYFLARKGVDVVDRLFRIDGLPGATVKRHKQDIINMLSDEALAEEFSYAQEVLKSDRQKCKNVERKLKANLKEQAVKLGMHEQVLMTKSLIAEFVGVVVSTDSVNESAMLAEAEKFSHLESESSWRFPFYECAALSVTNE